MSGPVKETRLRIGIDVDEVLADFVGAFRQVCEQTTGRVFPEEPTAWEFSNWNLSKKEYSAAWDTIKNTRNFHMRMEVLGDYSLELGKLNDECVVYFVTSRRGTVNSLAVEHQTAHWLARKFDLVYPQVIAVPDKGPIASALRLDAFIDDKPDNLLNIRDHSPNTQLFLQDHAWNRDLGMPHSGFKYTRVQTFSEFANECLVTQAFLNQ